MSNCTRSLATLALALTLGIELAPSRAFALGNDALIFIGPSSLTVSYGDLQAQIEAAGAPHVDVTGTWPAGSDLASMYRLVVITPYGGTLPSSVGDDLAAFAAAGGGVVVMGEHDFGTEAGDAIATRLGVSLRFENNATSGGCGSTGVATSVHPLTAGTTELNFAWSRTVMGGTLLYGSTVPIVVTEGTLVLAGDSDIFSDPVALGGCPHGSDNQRFFRNLYTSLPDATIGMMMGGDAGSSASDGGMMTMLPGFGSSCAASTDCSSGICIDDESVRYCTMTCTDSCPNNFTCSDVGGSRVCLAPRSGGGCSVSHERGRATGWIALSLVLTLLGTRPRRDRSAAPRGPACARARRASPSRPR